VWKKERAIKGTEESDRNLLAAGLDLGGLRDAVSDRDPVERNYRESEYPRGVACIAIPFRY
jgi:hypothetical protein